MLKSMTAGNALQHKHSILYYLFGLNMLIYQKIIIYIKLIVPQNLFISVVYMLIVNFPAIPYKVPARRESLIGGYKAMPRTVHVARARQGQP